MRSPSEWVVRHADLLPHDGDVLDVAAGSGRHTRFLRARGHRVVAVDRDVTALADLVDRPGVEVVRADLEAGPWPFPGRRFAAVVVTDYLHRPLLPVLVDVIGPGGVLVYETFAVGNERFGRPRNPAYLLRPGELRAAVRPALEVVAAEEVTSPRPARVQRIVAFRPQRGG